MYKLLSFVGLTVPGVVGLPPVVYAASTVANYRELWKLRVDYNGALDSCSNNEKQYLLNYQISNQKDNAILIEVLRGKGKWMPGEMEKYVREAEVMWTQGEKKFTIKDGNMGDSWGVDVVYCAGSEETFSGGLEGEKNKQWRIKLSKLSEQFRVQKDENCSKGIFKVICSVEKDDRNIKEWGWDSKLSGPIEVKWKLPKLIYTPF